MYTLNVTGYQNNNLYLWLLNRANVAGVPPPKQQKRCRIAIHNVTDSALLVKKSRKTIQRYIANGKLTATRDDSGNPRIDTAELIRVFGNVAVVSQRKISKKSHDVAPKMSQQNNTINITSEQLELIVQTAVEKALLKVMPLLIEDKTTGANSNYMSGRTYTKNKDDYKQPKRDLTSSSGYMDNMSFLDKRFKR